jgi:hypothetical protein
MPSKRDILGQLSRDELASVVDQYELSPAGRRKKDDLLEAVATSRKAKLEEILSEYTRDRLKGLCQGLGLDDSGREKSVLVDRIIVTHLRAAYRRCEAFVASRATEACFGKVAGPCCADRNQETPCSLVS